MSDEKQTISDINIGEMLRAAREGKGLSISAAALHCNLEDSIIETLEANKFSEFSSPVFPRGYLNLYARGLGLGLNEIEIIEEAFNNQLKSSPTPSDLGLGLNEIETIEETFNNQLESSLEPSLQISEANAASQSKSFK